MNNQNCQCLHHNNLLSIDQYGFRTKYSTIDSLLFCTEIIKSKTDVSNVVTAAFLDLSKAFDSMNYEFLIIKLDNLGFDDSSKKLKRNFLTNRCQFGILQDCLSDEISLPRVVPQGALLGPLLFNLYIIGMAKSLGKETELIEYVDDTVILTFGTSIDESKAKLEQDANKLIQYFHEHQLI